MPSFGKGKGSRKSHDMRLSVLPGMALLISPSLRTYTDNIGIWWVQFPSIQACFGSILPVIPPLFGVGDTLDLMILT